MNDHCIPEDQMVMQTIDQAKRITTENNKYNQQGNHYTLITPKPWNLLSVFRVTVVEFSSRAPIGDFFTDILTSMAAPEHSWHSTNMFSVAPIRSKLGADKTFLEWKEEEHRQETQRFSQFFKEVKSSLFDFSLRFKAHSHPTVNGPLRGGL